MSSLSQSRLYRIVDNVEEMLIAVLLGLMTLITFANVVARYVFNANILWGLEATVFLFAWLILLGASYAVKHSIHIGVDVFIQMLPRELHKAFSLLAALACVAFAVLLLIGSWNYWYAFVTTMAFLETNDIPMPGFLQFFATWLNDGELYEKLPRFIPYAVLPISMALLSLRFIQATWRIYTGAQKTLIAAHEAEDIYEDAAKASYPDHTKTGD